MGAAPILYPSEGSHAFGRVDFDCKYTVGSTGALTAVRNGGIYSITRNGAGDYTAVLDAKYLDVYNFVGSISGTFDRTNGLMVWLSAVSNDSATGYTSVQFFVYPADGSSTTKTDILSGNTLRFFMTAKYMQASANGTS